ncbi:putative abhydrolase-containing protein 5 [Coleophoma cylindrospora]|uniref:Putative abhydrolase-containing protein 5 n=1 Tax=Coleophoma cylindrospora TaxID=1849047 RepID=A0A3D8RZT3_9HELO|nr:putative abhydrolase-containing protein 5 [Coleophoma cylindrospora]
MSASASSNTSSGGQQPMLASQRAKAAGETRKSTFFPLGYNQAFSQWWASITPAMAEHNVMAFIPYLQKPPTHTKTGSAPVSAAQSTMSIDSDASRVSPVVQTTSLTDPYGPRAWHSNLIQLSGKGRALNEFSVERVDEEVQENLVMLHGYGAGLGFFYKNFEGLSRAKGWKIYALDMLGMGRSSRPTFKIHAKDHQGKIDEAENWFIDALEEWRVLKKIDKFTLLGHSMGGYMAVAYALKYPGHLNKLILASPVGIPEDPYAVKADMPEPEDSTMANEFIQDQEDDIVNQGGTGKVNGDNNNFLNARSKASDKDKKPSSDAPPRRPLPKWLTYLWDANISPFSIVRLTGPFGPKFVSGWTSRRFSHLPFEESEALHQYAYSLFRQRGSGEYALAYILAPGAFARSPLIRRIQGVGRQNIPPPKDGGSIERAAVTVTKETGIPVVMMYGDHDWMDVTGGYAAERKIQDEKAKVLQTATEEEKRLENGNAKVVIIKQAGHHLYLDGWEEFNEVMRKEMDETSRDTKKFNSRS